MSPKPYVFISYSRRDYYFAESLAFHLARHGVRTWFDAKDLVPGGDWQQQVSDALTVTDVVVLVASPAAFESDYVRDEWQHAVAQKKRIILLSWNRTASVDVGTAIVLPDSLASLWRHQWVDFRRWSKQRPDRAVRLPSIPESVEGLRVPAAVGTTHRLACAYGALLFVLGMAIAPEESAQSESVSAVELVSTLTAMLGVSVTYPASRFLRRDLVARRARRWVLSVFGGGAVLGLLSLLELQSGHGSSLPAVASLAGLVILPCWVWLLRGTVRFWYPTPLPKDKARDAAEKEHGRSRLTPRGNWQTTLTFVLFVSFWMLLLDQSF